MNVRSCLRGSRPEAVGRYHAVSASASPGKRHVRQSRLGLVPGWRCRRRHDNVPQLASSPLASHHTLARMRFNRSCGLPSSMSICCTPSGAMTRFVTSRLFTMQRAFCRPIRRIDVAGRSHRADLVGVSVPRQRAVALQRDLPVFNRPPRRSGESANEIETTKGKLTSIGKL